MKIGSGLEEGSGLGKSSGLKESLGTRGIGRLVRGLFWWMGVILERRG